MRGLKTHTVTIGDSLQKLARLYEIDDWRDIAQVNNLHSPYIDSVFQSNDYLDDEGVAKVGDVILIPNLNGIRHISKSKDEELESLAYGIDLDLYGDNIVSTEEEGSLSIEGTDVKLAKGLDNLAQQLKIRLGTKKGALLLHPDFGSNIHKYTGKLDRFEDRNKLIFEAESCLRSDFRVKDVKNLKIFPENGYNYLLAEIIPIEPGQPFKLYKFLN